MRLKYCRNTGGQITYSREQTNIKLTLITNQPQEIRSCNTSSRGETQRAKKCGSADSQRQLSSNTSNTSKDLLAVHSRAVEARQQHNGGTLPSRYMRNNVPLVKPSAKLVPFISSPLEKCS